MRPTPLSLCWLVLVLCSGCGAGADAASVALRDQAILDGERADRDNIYATVALVEAQAWATFCSGTLIAPNVVLTAAHCLVEFDARGRVVGLRDPAAFRVVAGVTYVGSTEPSDGHVVRRTLPHPSFAREAPEDATTGFGHLHDIGLVVTEDALDELEPAPVLRAETIAETLVEGTALRIEGFGTSERTGREGVGFLRFSEVPLVKLGADELIAGEPGTSDTCPGDSGGPVYVERDGIMQVLGVTSRAIASSRVPCGEGGIYTLAPAHLEFIRSEVPEAGITPDPAVAYDAGVADDPGSGFAQAASPATASDPMQPPGTPPAGLRSSPQGCSAGAGPQGGGAGLAAVLLGLLLRMTRRRRPRVRT